MSSLVMVMAAPFRSNILTLPRVFDKARHAVVTCGPFWRVGDCATGYAEVIPGPDRAITPGLSGPGNSSDFHFGVLSLSFQLLPRAPREGGAHVVRAATPLYLAQRSEARANLF